MSLLKHDTQRLEVRLQTLLAPPPYSHAYLLQLDFSADQPLVYFQIHYTDRDPLTEEEIVEEGFSLQDDFEWKGALPKAWKEATLDFLGKTKALFESPKPNTQNLLELTIDYGSQEQKQGIPGNAEDWEYFVQEVIQAIYELSEKELPLEISYVAQEKSSKQTIRILSSFSHRSLQVIREKNGKKEEKQLPWEQLMPLLQAVYLPDYQTEKAKQKLPGKEGRYIHIGDGLWYEFGTSVTNPSKKVDAVGKLEKMLKNFFP